MGLTLFSEQSNAQIDMIKHKIHSGWEFAFANNGKINTPDDIKTLKFLPATVPGTNLKDLTFHHLVEKNISASYEASFAPFKHKDFIYRTTFVCDDLLEKDHIVLCFEGLDTVCEIFLNGVKLSSADNAFIKYEFDIKKQIKKGINTLLIIFRSPVIEAENRMKKFGTAMPDHSSPKTNFAFLRKPAYSFFWDWGPEIPVSGIYRPVYVKAFDIAEIRDFYISYKILNNSVNGFVEVETPGGNGSEVKVEINGKIFSEKVIKEKAKVAFKVNPVKLWYPNGEGEPHLYNIKIALENKKILDEKNHRIGFRTIEIMRDDRKDGMGKRFVFKINGREIFIRGYNWIPVDNDITHGYYDMYGKNLDLAKEGNVNMLRIWGGGYYEDDEFYRMCDERGIMVWQDGMFACTLYPETDTDFMESVKCELTYNIKRLRNYTSLALWCGENECHWGYEEWWGEKYDRFYGTEIYEKLYPQLVKELDPDRIYWNGSPYSGEGILANNRYNGDTHFWELHSDCRDFKDYQRHKGSFISETGIQSLPDLRTALTIGGPEDKNINSFVFDSRNHYENTEKNERLLKFTGALFRVSDKFDRAVILSNLAQAMYLKYAVEHWRSLAYDCGGVLIWQLNDCWPAVSWSAVDYNLIPKASWYFLKKAYANDIVMFIQNFANDYDPQINSTGTLYVASERDGKKTGRVTMNIYNVNNTLFEIQEFPVKLDGRGVISLGEITLPDYKNRRFDAIAEFILKWNDGTTARNMYTYSRPKHMNLTDPKITLTQKGKNEISVRAKLFAKGVYLFHPHIDVIFDDNYFDLLPGEEKIVGTSVPVNVDDIKVWSYYH